MNEVPSSTIIAIISIMAAAILASIIFLVVSNAQDGNNSLLGRQQNVNTALEDAKWEQYNGRDVTGSSLISMIGDSYGEQVAITVDGDWYLYTIDADGRLSRKVDSKSAVITQAKNTIVKNQVYTGYMITNDLGDILGVGFSSTGVPEDTTIHVQGRTVQIVQAEGIRNIRGAGSYLPGTEVTVSASLKDGYQWNDPNWKKTSVTGEEEITGSSFTFTMGNEDIILIPNVRKGGDYQIVYRFPDGAVYDAAKFPTSYTSGDSLDIKEKPTLYGYRFLGWKTNIPGAAKKYVKTPIAYDADGNATEYTTIEFSEDLRITEDLHQDLYVEAVFISNMRTICFHPNGGSTPSFEAKQLVPGEKLGVLPTVGWPGGARKFVGWYTQEEGGTRLSEVSTMPDGPLNEQVHCYAHWQTVLWDQD